MFLSFVNFYKRFVYHYSKKVASLINLLKKSKNDKKFDFFVWSNEAK